MFSIENKNEYCTLVLIIYLLTIKLNYDFNLKGTFLIYLVFE